MQKTHDYDDIRYFIGNVRDKDRLKRALKSVDVVIHAAALKQVTALEYNPTEAVKTNVYGTQNVIDACIDCGVEKAIFISTDKAVNPINLYGATKLTAEKLWNAANVYNRTSFSTVRYGNVIGSRGSVIPLFQSLRGRRIPVTDPLMTRFWLTLKQAVDLILYTYRQDSVGVYVPKLKSMDMEALAKCFSDEIEIIGPRPGEKTHESLIARGEKVFLTDLKSHELTTRTCTSATAPRFTKEQMLLAIGVKKPSLIDG